MIVPCPVEWREAPETLTLSRVEVHVWRASLNLTASRLQGLAETLNAEERFRSECFHFRNDQEHFIASRGILRSILGSYLATPPCSLQFSYNPYGKPALAGKFAENHLRFNLTHSHGLALYAVTLDREIGVDIERIRPYYAEDPIPEQFFSSRETAKLRALPFHLQQEAFFRCWARKEAYIKARGEGLSFQLEQFDVSLGPGEPASLVWVEGNSNETSRWSMQDLPAGPPYVAALAAEGQNWRHCLWQWPSGSTAPLH